ncbi:hypothetical protein EVAR_3900_1 [Eumeta japonica]|uniref:TIL domain-containing protein n=1 Tax=Eumeta variegata TaxID=151549 RepID=A0A4C1SRE5_EUMVA|nr:hypothetical protein EVAR_3900_1 [Eumeta japonica]
MPVASSVPCARDSVAMNSFTLVFLAVVGLAAADTVLYPRGCIYIMGKCFRECEEGTHAYSTGCGPRTPEATCDNPEPQPEPGALCDYSACYCDAPTVRDGASGKCVPPHHCPKKE